MPFPPQAHSGLVDVGRLLELILYQNQEQKMEITINKKEIILVMSDGSKFLLKQSAPGYLEVTMLDDGLDMDESMLAYQRISNTTVELC